MNIHISKEEHEFLLEHKNTEFLFGSHLYGTNTKNSDKDILITYNYPKEWFPYILPYPNIHQFQYKDIENNIDYIWVSNEHFFKNQASGESTINSDIVLLDSGIINTNKIYMCRTYNVLKGYLGFAKRDIKHWKEGKHKLQHASRGLITVKKLWNFEIPTKDDIINSYNINYDVHTKKSLEEEVSKMRNIINDAFNNGELKMFMQQFLKDPLLQKLIDSNNVREFKY